MSLRSRPEDRARLRVANRYLDDPVLGMELLAGLIAQPEDKPEVAQKLERLGRLVRDDLLDACRYEDLPNEAEVYLKLQAALEKLTELAQFSALANKNVVAVGGGFSAGKSQLLNCLLQDDLLPTKTTPTTAIPTYLAAGEAEAIVALNRFNAPVALDREAVKAIGHDFNLRYNVSFSHIIKVLTVEVPGFPYDNIAFLDTPGYSRSDSCVAGDNTDERVAREHLGQADHLVWVVDAANGTLPSTDLQFIRSLGLQPHQKVFVVVNKADQPTGGRADVEAIVAKVREELARAGIPCGGVGAYHSTAKGDPEVLGDSLRAYLVEVNGKRKWADIRREFHEGFEEFLRHNQAEHEKARAALGPLNALYLRGSEGFGEEDRALLTRLLAETKAAANQAVQALGRFQSLRTEALGCVDEVLETLRVKEEDATAGGVCGTACVRDAAALARIAVDQRLAGRVVQANALGVYVECGLGDSVWLDPAEINKKYTGPAARWFPAGAECGVRVVELDRLKKTARVVVCPAPSP